MAKKKSAETPITHKDNAHYKEILKIIRKLSDRHSVWNVFCDFVKITSITISNCVARTEYDDREEQYLAIIRKYTKDEQECLAGMFAELILALEDEVKSDNFHDVLGDIFDTLKLYDNQKGQFFTPQHICDMIAKITIDKDDKTIAEKGFITFCDPCCGAGRMALGFANAMLSLGYSVNTQMFVEAADISEVCVHMSYVQLSLYGIPAVVIHGNTITTERWSLWYTPLFVVGGWEVKLKPA
ncbi:hypothetical protein AGMMS49975_26460 [Clostridia bacterium]|nr:hypothetical protein AGMMS49975_26460 [Clostridia bacterium]